MKHLRVIHIFAEKVAAAFNAIIVSFSSDGFGDIEDNIWRSFFNKGVFINEQRSGS